jgi:RecB family exonuclease
MKQILSSKWKKWNVDQDKEEKCFDLCINYLKNFSTKYNLNSNVVAKEFSFKVSYKDDILSGKIDRIDKLEDGTYEIVEYKLGDENKKDSEEIKKDLQWYIYWYSFKKKFPGFNPKLVTFYFLESNRKVSFMAEKKDENNANVRLNSKIEEIKNEKVFIQKSGKYCNNCYFFNKECWPRRDNGRSRD